MNTENDNSLAALGNMNRLVDRHPRIANTVAIALIVAGIISILNGQSLDSNTGRPNLPPGNPKDPDHPAELNSTRLSIEFTAQPSQGWLDVFNKIQEDVVKNGLAPNSSGRYVFEIISITINPNNTDNDSQAIQPNDENKTSTFSSRNIDALNEAMRTGDFNSYFANRNNRSLREGETLIIEYKAIEASESSRREHWQNVVAAVLNGQSSNPENITV